MNNSFKLQAVGEALYGARWQSAIEADIGVTHRTIRSWMTGEKSVPDDICSQLATIMRLRGIILETALDNLNSERTELDRAIDLAESAHADQVDKAGADYIRHPLRLCNRVSGIQVKCAALLHDVVEDSNYTLENLRDAGISDAVVTAVDALTKRAGESKEAAVTRARDNDIARVVKLADLEDNADLARFDEPSDEDRTRAARYEKLQKILR